MPSKAILRVNLNRDLYDFVKAAVKTGGYTSESEIVRDALPVKRDLALKEPERKIGEGIESSRRGVKHEIATR